MSENTGWQIKTFRSPGSSVNKGDDMARVYIDLPLKEAKKLLNSLYADIEDKDLLLYEMIEDINSLKDSSSENLKKISSMHHKLHALGKNIKKIKL